MKKLFVALLVVTAAACAYFYLNIPKTHKDFMEKASKYLDKLDYKNADRMLDEAIMLDPMSSEAFREKGNCLEELDVW